jgi:hypothetical protein
MRLSSSAPLRCVSPTPLTRLADGAGGPRQAPQPGASQSPISDNSADAHQVAAEVSAAMFARGEVWRGVTAPSMQQLSQGNLARLRQELGGLHPQERSFVEFARARPWFVTHFTRSPKLDAAGDVWLRSHKQLVDAGVLFHDMHTLGADKTRVAANDYINFSLEVGAGRKKTTSRFGPIEYRASLAHPRVGAAGWLSMDEMVAPPSAMSKWFRNNNCIEGLISGLEFLDVLQKKTNTAEYVFAGPDMLDGLLLTLLASLRPTQQSTRDAIFGIDNDDDLNRLVNKLYRPELKVPQEVRLQAGSFEKFVATTWMGMAIENEAVVPRRRAYAA